MRLFHFFCFLASLSLALGLWLPCLEVQPKFGELTPIVKALDASFGKSATYSIMSGILELFGQREYFVGSLLFLFSVLFPVFKLGFIWQAGCGASRGLDLASKLGKWSMLDIFVLALLVLSIKGLPGGSLASMKIGVVFFSLGVIGSMFLPAMVKRYSHL